MKALRITLLAAALAAMTLVAGCSKLSEEAPTNGVYMLIDTSGTYTTQLDKAKKIIDYVLAKLNPGDTFAVASINTGSFTENDIIAKVTFDDRPSMANAQKRIFAAKIEKYIKHVHPSAYTDVTGGVLQAIQFLNEANTAHKTILIFSDLDQDLKKGYVRNIPLKLEGFNVVALNVIKLRSDNIDPRLYLGRLKEWKQKVNAGGGTWRVVNNLERLNDILGNNG